MARLSIYSVELFEKLVYKEEYGDRETVEKDFINFIKVAPFKIQILFALWDRECSSSELEEFEFSFAFSGFPAVRYSMKQDDLIEVSKKEGKKEFYIISGYGKNYLKEYIAKNFITKNHFIIENIKLSRKKRNGEFVAETDSIKELIKKSFAYLESIPQIKNYIMEGHFVFDISEFVEPELLDFMFENFEEAKAIFQTILEQFVDDKEHFNQIKDNIKFVGLEKFTTQYYKIANIPKDTKEFLHTTGLLVHKSSKIKEEVFKHHFLCVNPECKWAEQKLSAPDMVKVCPQCKSPLELIDRTIKSCLTLEIRDMESDSILKVKVYDNLIREFSEVKVGEELDIFGHMDYLQEQKQPHQKITFERCFILNNFKLSNNSVTLTKEERKEIEQEIKKIIDAEGDLRPFLFEPIKKMYPKHPDNLFTMTAIPQVLNFNSMVEDIVHLLFIGSPNTYKTSFVSSMGKIFPKMKKIQLRQLSIDKFYGGVKGDGLTDVGIAMTQRDGALIIDEIDKDVDSYEKSSNMLNEVMTEQTATKERVGASIFLKDVNMRIYGILNHDALYKDEPLKWILKKVHESTLTRFFLIDFDDFITQEIRNEIIENSVKIKSNPLDDYDFDLRKKIIVYLRKAQVDLSPIESQLIHYLKAVNQLSLNYEHTTRNIQQIKNIVVALCRLKGKSVASIDELDEAKELISWTFKTQKITLDQYVHNISKETIEQHTIRESNSCYSAVRKLFKDTDSVWTYDEIYSKLKQFDKKEIDKILQRLKDSSIIFEPIKNQLRCLENEVSQNV